jgi:hypothetical protein
LLHKSIEVESYKTLNLKDLRDDALLSLSSALATLLKVLRIIGRNDVLSRLGMIQHGLSMWGNLVEGVVEDTGSNEGIDIADVETVMLA